jgi:hypothetical protein
VYSRSKFWWGCEKCGSSTISQIDEFALDDVLTTAATGLSGILFGGRLAQGAIVFSPTVETTVALDSSVTERLRQITIAPVLLFEAIGTMSTVITVDDYELQNGRRIPTLVGLPTIGAGHNISPFGKIA